MRAQIILIALLTIGYILVCTPVQSFGQQRGSLRGTVTDDRGKPLRGISITVEQLGGLTTTVETNKDGRYELRDLEPGIYAVTLNAPGSHIYKYEIQIQPFQPTVRDFSVGFGQGPIPPVPRSTPPNETSGGKKPKTPNATSGGKKPKTPNDTRPTVNTIDEHDTLE